MTPRPSTPARIPDADAAVPTQTPGRAWWENALLFGLVLSLLLHLLLALVTSWWSLRIAGPAALAEGQAFELAADRRDALTETASVRLSGADMSVRPLAVEQQFTIVDLHSPFASLDGGDASLLPVEGLAGSGDAAGDGLGLDGAGGEARFFGVEARGSRFAFVVDVSGSMSDPAKIGALQAALLDSVEGLLGSASFCIVLYSGDALPLMGDRWIRASDENKSAARRNITQMTAAGSTNPIPAFRLVFDLKPRPDAIYFMTDGVFSKDVEEELPGFIDLENRDGDTRVTVHCLTFADRGAEKLMRRIARQSGGSYTHVEGPRK